MYSLRRAAGGLPCPADGSCFRHPFTHHGHLSGKTREAAGPQSHMSPITIASIIVMSVFYAVPTGLVTGVIVRPVQEVQKISGPDNCL